MTTLLAIFVDAWEQFKLQRVRVILSLFGVMLAVAALTASLVLGNIMAKMQDEISVRYSGPEATYNIYVNDEDAPPAQELIDSFERVVQRYNLNYGTALMYFNPEFSELMWAEGRAVSPGYFPMHGQRLIEGRLLVDSDADRLMPVAVLTQTMADELGVHDLVNSPEVRMKDGKRLVVVGIVQDNFVGDTVMYIHSDAYFDFFAVEEEMSMPELRVWVPPEEATEFGQRVVLDLRRDLGYSGITADRYDAGAYYEGGMDPATVTQLVLVSVSVAILGLGALSLINIAVVTVRYRIREFGIRRAFGASQTRIFIGVLMESVLGTLLAGIAGVALVALLYRSGLGEQLAQSLDLMTLPLFPISAAVIGVITSVITGVAAGLIPALIAVRSKVIDAIRF